MSIQISTEVIGRSGSIVFVELREHRFFRTCEIEELWKLRRDLREAKHIPASCRLRTFRELERIEAEIETNPFPVDEDVEVGSDQVAGLLMMLGSVSGVIVLIWWVLWGLR